MSKAVTTKKSRLRSDFARIAICAQLGLSAAASPTVCAASTAASTHTPTKAVVQSAVSAPIADKWALVIGVGEFMDPDITPLRFAAKDARDFADFLVTKAHFAPDHVRLVTDKEATQRRILTELGDKYLPRVVKPGDLVLIYFSGHGSPSDVDIKSQNYLIAYDSEKTNLFASGIELQDFARLIKRRVNTDRVVLVLDACHSGAADPHAKDLKRSGVNPLVIAGEGQLIICSSGPDETSWESRRYNNGVFTHHLMSAMEKDGKNAGLGKVFHDMQEGVADEVQQDYGERQRPLLRSEWSGADLPLAALPNAPRMFPESVKKLLDEPGETVVSPMASTSPYPPAAPTPNPSPLRSRLIFSPADGAFSVRVPVPLEKQHNPDPSSPQDTYAVQTRSADYQVICARLPIKPGQMSESQIFQTAAKQLVADMGTHNFRTFSFVREFDIGGHPAGEYSIWSDSKQGRCVLAVAGNKLLSFTGTVDANGNVEELKDFFDSISLR